MRIQRERDQAEIKFKSKFLDGPTVSDLGDLPLQLAYHHYGTSLLQPALGAQTRRYKHLLSLV